MRVTLGDANGLLYQIVRHQTPNSPAFHDITSGCANPFCAGPGYDLVTGLGSPDAWNIAADLNAQIETNIESEVVWGYNAGNNIVNLVAARNKSDSPGWQVMNVTSVIQTLTNQSLNLTANTGQPAVVSYPTNGDGTEMDVFALTSVNGVASFAAGLDNSEVEPNGVEFPY